MTTHSLVWFKRDLRIRDHAPLAAAQTLDSALALFVIEPEWLVSPECDPQHVAFTLDCLSELRADLALLGLPLWVHVGTATSALNEVHTQFAFTHLLSHEETGSGWSYTRDLAVAAWCKQQSVEWHEWTQTGVVRRLKSRFGWAGNWSARMDTAPSVVEGSFKATTGEIGRAHV